MQQLLYDFYTTMHLSEIATEYTKGQPWAHTKHPLDTSLQSDCAL